MALNCHWFTREQLGKSCTVGSRTMLAPLRWPVEAVLGAERSLVSIKRTSSSIVTCFRWFYYPFSQKQTQKLEMHHWGLHYITFHYCWEKKSKLLQYIENPKDCTTHRIQSVLPGVMLLCPSICPLICHLSTVSSSLWHWRHGALLSQLLCLQVTLLLLKLDLIDNHNRGHWVPSSLWLHRVSNFWKVILRHVSFPKLCFMRCFEHIFELWSNF